MLAQHLVTRPVFEALFENYSFVKNNPVSKYLENILPILNMENISADSEQLKKFYDSVRERCKIATSAEDKQKIIIELYEKFFKTAKTVERLSIVYMPVEIVDAETIRRLRDAGRYFLLENVFTDKNCIIREKKITWNVKVIRQT